MGDPRTVFVVDDDADMRRVVRLLLERDGHRVVGEAGDGGDGLAALRALGQRPDIVLLDQNMPGMLGVEVAAELLDEQPDSCVVIFTAAPTDGQLRERAEAVGVRALLSKSQISSLGQLVDSLPRAGECPDGRRRAGHHARGGEALRERLEERRPPCGERRPS